MTNREILLKKIDAQKKEWQAQFKHLQSKAENFEVDARIEFEKEMDKLHNHLKEAEKKSEEYQKIASDAWNDLGANIERTWNELVMNIDNAILRLKK